MFKKVLGIILAAALGIAATTGINIDTKADEVPVNQLSATTYVTGGLGTLAGDVGLTALTLNGGAAYNSVIPLVCGGSEYLFMPSNTDYSNMIFHFKEGVTLTCVNGKNELPIVSDYPVDITKMLQKAQADGSQELCFRMSIGDAFFEYTLKVMKSANIASMFINSDDPVKKGLYYVASNKDNKSTGTATLINADNSVVYAGGLSQIKTRGNSTWISVKKPFQIKLAAKTDLIETGNASNADKTWILLANAYDPTLIHNQAAYNMAQNMGLNAPDGRQVDLYFDGRYMGTYFLCEKIASGAGRVPINDKGYLLELDMAYYNQEENYFTDITGTSFVIKEPEKISAKQKEAIEFYMNEIMVACANGGVSPTSGLKVSDMVDLDSLARNYVFQQTVKNPDAFVSSTYFYLPEGGKLVAGPMWDYDSAFGIKAEGNMTSASGTCVYSDWMNSFLGLPEFQAAVKNAKKDMNKIASNMANTGISAYVKNISASEKMNRAVWSDYSLGMYSEKPTYNENISVMKNFLRNRIGWVNSNVK